MLTIGKVAARAKVTPDTLRYYEREGLIQPAGKTPSGYRLYDAGQVQRLQFIKQAKECGFALGEIRQLLSVRARPAACCDDVRRLALDKKLQIEAKVKAMKAMSRALDGLIANCAREARPIEECPILAAFDGPPRDA